MASFAADCHLLDSDSHSPDTLARVRELLAGEPLDFPFIEGDHTEAGVDAILQGMRWTLIQLQGFRSLWKSERLSDEDLQRLEAEVMLDPARPRVMRGTGGLRKARFAPPSRGKGKSGSMRVGYAQFPEHGRIYLVTLFLKKDQESLSDNTRNTIKVLLDRIAAALAKGEEP